MKKLLILVLACALGLTCWVAPAEGGNALGFQILNTLWDGQSNCFVSPVSLDIALAMAACGAEGETREEILSALGVRDEGEIAALCPVLNASGLKTANAAFVNERFAMKDGYVSALREKFGAELFPLGDQARADAWVKEHTDGLIDSLPPAPESTLFMLTNAVCMDAEWYLKFENYMTNEQDFRTPDGEVTVQMMHRYEELYSYAENEAMQLLCLGYRDSDLYMLLALPKDGDVRRALAWFEENGIESIAFEEQSPESIINAILERNEKYGWSEYVSREELEKLYPSSLPYIVNLSLPKLDLSMQNSLTAPLKSCGVTSMFDPAKADFSGISDDWIYIEEVLQKLRVQVDEEGTRAAAVTAMMADGAALPYAERVAVDFTCDRPFVVLIADEKSGSACFAGVVTNPNE